MSLDVYLEVVQPCEVYWSNVTHNLGKMAAAAGLYQPLWRPEELGYSRAGELIVPLRKGLEFLLEMPDYFRQFDDPNGWGTYDNFVGFVNAYLKACEANPEATVRVSR